MLSRSSIFLLPFLVILVCGKKDTLKDPVDVLQIEHLLIDFYDGPLKHDTLTIFENINYLHLSNSNFSPFNTSFLLALPNLRRLRMTSNTIVPVNADITGCCNKLQELDVSFKSGKNHGEVELFKMIKAMSSLKHLTLHNMNIGVLKDDNFLSSTITNFYIPYCNVTIIKNNAFAKLENLEMLDLQGNSIKDFTKEVFAPLKNVKFINMRGNLLEKLTTDQFPYLPNLEMLGMSYNPLKQLNLEGIEKVAPKLKMVDVSGTDIAPTEFGDVNIVNPSYRRKIV